MQVKITFLLIKKSFQALNIIFYLSIITMVTRFVTMFSILYFVCVQTTMRITEHLNSSSSWTVRFKKWKNPYTHCSYRNTAK